MAGIDQELSMREMAVGGNPQAAQQRYAQSKSLMDLLVAQKVSNDYAAARNAMQAATQVPAGSIKDQLDMSNAQVTRNDMMRSMMPGVQMKAARDSQAMQRQAMGIPTQPAPNIRMADGGIVGFAGPTGSYVDLNDETRFGVTENLLSPEEAQTLDAISRAITEQPGAARRRRRGPSVTTSTETDMEPRRIGRGRVLSGIGAGGAPATDSLGQMGRNRRVTPEVTPTPTDTGVTKEQFDAFTGMAQPKDEQKFITDPMLGDVLRQLQTGPVRPQEEPEEKKGIFDNVDIGRLQAFLAGGAGQTSTAGALGGGLRGLMAEDQRREALASKEAIEAAKIASQRYGAQLDYEAALARLDQDERNSIRSAQTDLIEKKLGAEASAAEKVLDFVVESDNVFNQQAMAIMEQYGDNPAMAGAQLTALLDERLDANMGPIRRQISGLGGSSGGTGEFTDLGTDED